MWTGFLEYVFLNFQAFQAYLVPYVTNFPDIYGYPIMTDIPFIISPPLYTTETLPSMKWRSFHLLFLDDSGRVVCNQTLG